MPAFWISRSGIIGGWRINMPRFSSAKRPGKGRVRCDLPIGVFDSGVGGLTVIQALRRRMPEESFLYFGDTAHVPYGTKSKEAVTRFSLAIGRYFAGRGIKMLVVACNTASALALPEIRKALRIPVIGVIQPGVRAAAAATRNKIVGVIATEATIRSQAYPKALLDFDPKIRVVGIACPLFVPLVEEGWWSHSVTRTVAQEYLRPIRRAKADTLILGCTHYPLIKPALRREAGNGVKLIDSASEVAREVDAWRRAYGLGRRGRKQSMEFIVSDGPDRFLKLARKFLGLRVSSVGVQRID